MDSYLLKHMQLLWKEVTIPFEYKDSKLLHVFLYLLHQLYKYSHTMKGYVYKAVTVLVVQFVFVSMTDMLQQLYKIKKIEDQTQPLPGLLQTKPGNSVYDWKLL